MVGNDSIDPTIVGAGEASMNFGGFAQGPPPGWEATVLHEFGHALGFQHEHQLPVGGCDLEFRWEDDPGYQPPPISSANSSSTPSSGDRASIPCSAARPTAGHRPRWTTTSASCATPMLHDRPVRPQLDHEVLLRGLDVRDGEQSHCFSQRNMELSPQDRKGFARAYPRGKTATKELLAARSCSQALAEAPALEAPARQRYAAQLEVMMEE